MTKKAYFEQSSRQGFVKSKSFWKTQHKRKYNHRKQSKLVGDKLKLTEIFNTHYINIIENSSGIPPSTAGNPNNPLENSNTLKNIIEVYKNHPSIINIRNQTNLNANAFDFPHATAEEINKIIKDINPKKELVLIRFHPKFQNFQQTLLI